MRIGLIGWGCKTGLGYQHYDMWHLGLAQSWLVVHHPKLGIDSDVAPPPSDKVLYCHRKQENVIYRKFLDNVDVVVFIERPVLEEFDLLAECRQRKIFTVCIPNHEWLPAAYKTAWVRNVSMMWAPVRFTIEKLREAVRKAKSMGLACQWAEHICGGRWGVNLDRFPFHQRTICRRLLFTNGWGGAENRKGIDIVAAAAELAPEIPLVVYSQRHVTGLPSNCEVHNENLIKPAELYQQGDVLLAPSRWEGVGLFLYEAQASGMPVIMTWGRPMDEAYAFRYIRASLSEVKLHGRPVQSQNADPQHLAELLRATYQADITADSTQARNNMARYCSLTDTFTQLRASIEQRYPDFKKAKK